MGVRENAELGLIADFSDALARFAELSERWRQTIAKIEDSAEGADITALEEEAAGLVREMQQVGQAGAVAMRDIAAGAAETEASLRELPKATDAVEEGLAQVVAGFQELAFAEGPAEQQQALEDLARTYVETGRVAAESFGAGSVEAEALTVIIEEIDQRVATMGDGLESSLSRGQEAWTKLERAMDAGGEGIQQRLVALQQAIRAYAAELERAEAAGENVTAAQREELAKLEEAYRRGTRVAGEYQAAQQQVARDLDKTTEAAGGQGRAILSLDDLLRTSGSNWGRYAVNVGAVVGTFTAFYNIGTKLRDVLNDISDGGFDEGIQRGFQALAEAIVGSDDAGQNLTRNLKILRDQGIDPTGLSAEQAAERILKIGRALIAANRARDDATDAAAAAAAAQREWEASLGLSKTALDEESAALARNISAYADANKATHSLRDIKELLGDQVQSLLDDYARIKEEPPPAIQQLVTLWGLVPTPIREARVELEGFGIAAKDAGADAVAAADGVGQLADQVDRLAASTAAKERVGDLEQSIADLAERERELSEQPLDASGLVELQQVQDDLAAAQFELRAATDAVAASTVAASEAVEDHGEALIEGIQSTAEWAAEQRGATQSLGEWAAEAADFSNSTAPELLKASEQLGTGAKDTAAAIDVLGLRQRVATETGSELRDVTAGQTLALRDLTDEQAAQVASLDDIKLGLDAASLAHAAAADAAIESAAAAVEGYDSMDEAQQRLLKGTIALRKALEVEGKKMAAAQVPVIDGWKEMNRLCEEHKQCLTGE